jgi:hypothetical protein
MADKWGGTGLHGTLLGLIAPAVDWTDLSSSVSDSTNLADVPRALYVHTAGNVRCVSANGSSATFTFAAGEVKSLRPTRIMATGTSTGLVAAGQIIGLY